MCLLILTFGTVWRVLESPSKGRVFVAALVSLLFAHSLYYSAIFLFAIFFSAALVATRARQWKLLMVMAGIGIAVLATLLVYLPIVQKASAYGRIMQIHFNFEVLWMKLKDTVSRRSSGEMPGTGASDVWLWLLLIAVGAGVAVAMQCRSANANGQRPDAVVAAQQKRADLALFSLSSLVCGVAGFIIFLCKLRFPTQAWYYMGMLTLCALAVEALLGVSWPALRPWGLARIALFLLVTAWGAPAVWREAHTRRSNVDLLAAILKEKAKPGDLIVVHFAFEGITFERYYHGAAQWMTVPPVESHKVHRSDLIAEKINELDPMAPILAEATATLRNGNSVWVVGRIPWAQAQSFLSTPPRQGEQPILQMEKFGHYWAAQLAAHLLARAAETHTFTTTLGVPVHFFEDLPLLQCTGCKPGSEDPGLPRGLGAPGLGSGQK